MAACVLDQLPLHALAPAGCFHELRRIFLVNPSPSAALAHALSGCVRVLLCDYLITSCLRGGRLGVARAGLPQMSADLMSRARSVLEVSICSSV